MTHRRHTDCQERKEHICVTTSTHERVMNFSQERVTNSTHFSPSSRTRRRTRRWHTDCQQRKEHLYNTILAHEPVTNSTHGSPLAHGSPREKHAKSSPSCCKTRQFTARGEQTIRKKERIKQARYFQSNVNRQ